MSGRLVDRDPRPGPARLLAELVPPPRFAAVRFAGYRPDPARPSQDAAVRALRAFADELARPPSRSLLGRRRRRSGPPGRYLDGGFGVGKTHLLASLWHEVPGPKVYGTFVGLTHLVGALGFAEAVRALSASRLVCIDEFELDDPGDTVLMSTLLGRLVAAGVRLAVTSNTLPDALGEGRFAATDFLREIHGLAGHFDVLQVDGSDYRHRGSPPAPQPWAADRVVAFAEETPGATHDDLDGLCAHLAGMHPSRYGALLDGVRAVALTGLHPVDDQNVALRLVVLADRLYDRDLPVVSDGRLEELFTPHLLTGGYRKKYLRARSRLLALARAGLTPR